MVIGRGEGITPLLQCLPSMPGVLCSLPGLHGLGVGGAEVRQGDQKHSSVHSEFKANRDYLRAYLKSKTTE